MGIFKKNQNNIQPAYMKKIREGVINIHDSEAICQVCDHFAHMNQVCNLFTFYPLINPKHSAWLITFIQEWRRSSFGLEILVILQGYHLNKLGRNPVDRTNLVEVR
jgi:hypothetical protein